MKRWERLADIYNMAAARNGYIKWERFAKTGACLGIGCEHCPFSKDGKFSGNCQSCEERAKYLNEEISVEEVNDEQSEGA